MATVWWTVKGPRLIRLLKHENNPGRDYVPNILESSGDKFMRVFQTCWSISWWSSPVIMTLLYRRGYMCQEGVMSIGKLLFSVGLIYAGAFCIRGLGRLTNADYTTFVKVLVDAINSHSVQSSRLLRRYDFEFWAWPVDFRWDDSGESKGERVGRPKVQVPFDKSLEPKGVKSLVYSVLSYCAIHTFGRRMVYPGATSLMQMLVGGMLNQGRAALIEEKKGERAKVLTEDLNEIDTMFVDKRSPGSRNGNTLVVVFEGNAGFYEMGCSGTPIEYGYSVLGWNHPGFAGSSGAPYPDAEQKAIDAVMQYAISRLGFQPDSIVLFAWSIGGYSASWAAMNYPDVKHLILDATFDDIVPLALTQMPQSWSGLVVMALRNHMNLNIADQLTKYPGPIKLIRRVRDEIIATEKTNNMIPVMASNRGNFLLVSLLEYRYPNVVNAETIPLLKDFLRGTRQHQDAMLMEHRVDVEQCQTMIRSYAQEVSSTFPMRIGDQLTHTAVNQLALFLAHKHLEDFDSTHCTPLPPSFLSPPWSPFS